MKRRTFEENGAEWVEVEHILPGGVRVRVYREFRSRADINSERAKPKVSPSLHRLLEKQEHLELLNKPGRFLLDAERQRGGRRPLKEPPKWWILDVLWKLYLRRNRIPLETLDGSLWKRIASEVTWRAREEGSKAKDESWLGENDKLSVNDVKNTWRETGLKWKDPG